MGKQVIKSPITGFGSKYRACREWGIHEYIPPMTANHQIYVEPFVFSGIMFFNIKCRTAIINDKLDLIWNFWKVVKEQRETLESELEYVWIGKKWFDEYQNRTDPIGRAVYFYLMNQASHKGIMESTFRYKPFNHPFTKDFKIWSDIMNAKASLTIWNLDFRDIFKKIWDNGAEHWSFVWYEDPPYYREGRYLMNFTDQDHTDLHDLNQELKDNPYHHIILSYNKCDYIEELYKGWYTIDVTWNMPSRSEGNDHKELLISNRPFKRYIDSPKKQTDFGNLIKK